MQRQIHIGVGGRFHADQMTLAFLNAGHNPTLFTSYPSDRFRILNDKSPIRSFLVPEILYRSLRQIHLEQRGEQAKMLSFGRWLRRASEREGNFDAAFVWSSFAQELFTRKRPGKTVLVRDSTHLEHQLQILEEENAARGIYFRPDPLCLKRELAEYQSADHILVLSRFAKKTFTDKGIDPQKVSVLHLGVNNSLFKPKLGAATRHPLRLIYFGTISVRKGIYHLLEATKAFSPKDLTLTLVGPVETPFLPVLKRYSHVTYHPAMAHEELAPFVAEHDCYVFPTLEDGFPNTLIQAMAAGLVPITTQQCGPADWVLNGINGFVIAPRSADSIESVLSKLVRDPSPLTPMKQAILRTATTRPWTAYARDLNRFLDEILGVSTQRSTLPRGNVNAGVSNEHRLHNQS